MSVRGVHRGIHSSLLDDPDYQQLSADGRLVLLTVRLCKQAGPGVIFRYYAEVVAAQTGLAIRRVTAALSELTAAAWVEIEGPVLWVRNGLRYDPSMRLADRKHRLAVERAVAELPRLAIVLKFCDYYEIARPFEGPSKGVTSLALRIPNTEEDRIPNTESLSRAADPAAPARGVLEFLNQKTGKAFRAKAANLDLIMARLKDGIPDWQLKAIVSRKTREWAGTDHAMYLRPKTLFSKTNCEQYIGELPPLPMEEPHA